VDNLSDSALISRVLVDDDRSAFSELVRRYQSQVRRLLRKLTGGDPTFADDLAQETFLRGYRSLKSYRGTARFSTWLCQIAYHCYLTEAGRAKTRAEVPEEAARPMHESAPGESREAGTLLQRDLARALESLNGEDRTGFRTRSVARGGRRRPRLPARHIEVTNKPRPRKARRAHGLLAE